MGAANVTWAPSRRETNDAAVYKRPLALPCIESKLSFDIIPDTMKHTWTNFPGKETGASSPCSIGSRWSAHQEIPSSSLASWASAPLTPFKNK
jgi:hypothetical protein